MRIDRYDPVNLLEMVTESSLEMEPDLSESRISVLKRSGYLGRESGLGETFRHRWASKYSTTNHVGAKHVEAQWRGSFMS